MDLQDRGHTVLKQQIIYIYEYTYLPENKKHIKSIKNRIQVFLKNSIIPKNKKITDYFLIFGKCNRRVQVIFNNKNVFKNTANRLPKTLRQKFII